MIKFQYKFTHKWLLFSGNAHKSKWSHFIPTCFGSLAYHYTTHILHSVLQQAAKLGSPSLWLYSMSIYDVIAEEKSRRRSRIYIEAHFQMHWENGVWETFFFNTRQSLILSQLFVYGCKRVVYILLTARQCFRERKTWPLNI